MVCPLPPVRVSATCTHTATSPLHWRHQPTDRHVRIFHSRMTRLHYLPKLTNHAPDALMMEVGFRWHDTICCASCSALMMSSAYETPTASTKGSPPSSTRILRRLMTPTGQPEKPTFPKLPVMRLRGPTEFRRDSAVASSSRYYLSCSFSNQTTTRALASSIRSLEVTHCEKPQSTAPHIFGS